ncbi:hypothetical protein OG905_17060 [Streptomyces sp. NBC_00322]|uniref:hypothetical protein n=1 Tax=Streptomyces sp. NBC_00322 TaxID=2975712 RepID=UPI002E27B539|nr:hypothetical protein [Streptomyces sp. NBC_00322]
MSDEEEVLRRGLKDLAEGGGQAGGLTAVEAFLAKAHRARARRRAAVAGCAVVLFAGGTGLGVRLSIGDRAPDSVVSKATESPSPPKGGPLATGPAKPEERVRYRYDMSQVCNLRHAVFGGRTWEVGGKGSRYVLRWAHEADRHSGYMTLIDTDTALFETDDPTLPALELHPVSGKVPCIGQEPQRALSDEPAYPMGPKNPRTGARYPYSMTKECEMQYAAFGGKWWKADEKSSSGVRVDWVNERPLAGYMTQVDSTTALLEIPQPKKTWKIHYQLVDHKGDECD